jgi:outer membrane immunogenic protein
MMKRLAVSLLAIAIVTGGAYAADVPEFEEDFPIVEEVWDWTGFYVGLKGGWAIGNANFAWPDYLPPTEADIAIDGWILGGVAGAGVQMGVFYLGVEGEVSWTNLGGVDSCENPQWDCFVDSKWLADIEGQIGVAAGPALIYVHGGFAAVNQDVGETDLIGVADGFGNDTATGWVAGVGAKVAVAENVHLVGEYSYYDVSASFPAGTVEPLSETVVNSTFHAVSLGVNVGF